MSAVADGTHTLLKQALHAAENERRACEARMQSLDAQIIHIQKAISGVEASQDEATRRSQLSISSERLSRIREYLDKVGEKRQVEISAETGENSGTVSVALRVLEAQGDAEKGELDRSSHIWRSTHPVKQNGAKRETKVRPGEGVSEGRLAA